MCMPLGSSSTTTISQPQFYEEPLPPNRAAMEQYASKAMQLKYPKSKKPNGKPKRPLLAYNLFFKSEREKLIRANRNLSFSNMAKEISVKWKAGDTEGRKVFVDAAGLERISYHSAVSEWKAQIEHQLQMNDTSQPSQFGRFSVPPMPVNAAVQPKPVVPSAAPPSSFRNGCVSVDYTPSSNDSLNLYGTEHAECTVVGCWL